MPKANSSIVLLCVFLFSSAQAQVTTGTIIGTARDASGAVLPKINLTLTNQRTNAIRTTVTDDRGDYSLPPFPPANTRSKPKPGGSRHS